MKERILATADRLFYLQGIRAVGVDTIAAEIGISKRTLYNHFPSKDALISAYLERRFVQPRPPINRSSNRSSARSIGWSGVLPRRIFAAARSSTRSPSWAREDRAVRKIAVAFKESRRLWFRDLLLKLGVADAEGLATQLTLLVDGSIAQDLVRKDPRWRAPPGKPRGCCWPMQGSMSATGAAEKPRRAHRRLERSSVSFLKPR